MTRSNFGKCLLEYLQAVLSSRKFRKPKIYRCRMVLKEKFKIISECPSYNLVWVCVIPGLLIMLRMIYYQFYAHLTYFGTTQMYIPPAPVPKNKSFNSDNLPSEITIVTAYFNLGTFQKGMLKEFTPEKYKNWMRSYSKVNNTVIAYTDSVEIELMLKEFRKEMPSHMTKVFLLERDSLWAFKLAPDIQKIYDLPGYPRYHPNTVNAMYSSAMHVKYEVIEKVIKEGLYKTKYIAWLDIGYFRDNENEIFSLIPPTNIRDDHISLLQINEFYSLSPATVVSNNVVWVAGGMFIGRPEYLIHFIEDYKKTVNWMMNQRLMSTDQQMLLVLYTKENNLHPRIPLQVYFHNCKCEWFYLGALCRNEWEKHHRKPWSLSALSLCFM